MRSHQQRLLLPLLLILSFEFGYALKAASPSSVRQDYGYDVAALAEGKAVSQDDKLNADSVPKYTSNVQAKDAPIDGKDGRPHTGPFVETSAERDRKKAKGSGDGEKTPATGDKAPVKGKGNLPKDAPETNDGVMDDPNRTGPKEGTRGTEGGISEKNSNKDSTSAIIGAEEGKKPDPPKEAPPLPHSEEGKVGSKDSTKKGADTISDNVDPTKERYKDKQKELGGLEVCAPLLLADSYVLILLSRNRKTCPPNRTIYHILLRRVHQSPTPWQYLRHTLHQFLSSPPLPNL